MYSIKEVFIFNIILHVIIISLMIFYGIGMSDERGAKEQLLKNGYVNITLKGHTIFGCGYGDFYKTKFTATNSSGFKINGVVCKGLFKGTTIRTK